MGRFLFHFGDVECLCLIGNYQLFSVLSFCVVCNCVILALERVDNQVSEVCFREMHELFAKKRERNFFSCQSLVSVKSSSSINLYVKFEF